MASCSEKKTFSLAGCGFLGVYHIGAATCLCEFVPHLLEDATFAGASAGALIAASIICKVPMNHCVDFTLRLARAAREHPLGGWEPSIKIEDILRSSMDAVLPPNAHELCTDRLFVSVTDLSMNNRRISKFETRNDLLDALLCSAFVPAFSSYSVPKFGKEYFLDGGLSDNLPMIDLDTITICPWAGEHSICPRDPEGQSFPLTIFNMSMCVTTENAARFKDAFFSPKPETLKNYCWQGYEDALRFLDENQLIHCQVHRVLTVLTNFEQRVSVTQNCVDCKHHRTHANNSHLSSEIEDQLTEEQKCDNGGTVSKIIRCPLTLARHPGLVTAPMRKLLNIWMIPISMIRDQVLQVFMIAYFHADKIRNGELGAEVMKLIKKLSSPRELLWDLLFKIFSKCFFAVTEYFVRMLSEMVAAASCILFTHRVLSHKACPDCGMLYSQRPAPLRPRPLTQTPPAPQVPAPQQAVESVVVVEEPSAAEAEDVVPVVIVEEPPSAADAIVTEPPSAAEVIITESSEELEAGGEMEMEEACTDPVALYVDIQANSVDMTIPVPDQAETVAPSPHTVHVDAVGDIQQVVINPVMLPPDQDLALQQAEGGQRSQAQAHSRAEMIHGYVHKFEQYKNVMTLHYVDENHQQRTESLFVEEEISAQEGAVGGVVGRVGGESEGVMEASGGQPEEPPAHDLKKEVTHLLEEKLFSEQRQFAKDYETSHQRRLKKLGLKEVRQGTGHYGLKVISFATDLPSSPALSRSSSIRSVNVEEGSELVNSLSDALSLATNAFPHGGARQRRNSQRPLNRTADDLDISQPSSSSQSLSAPSSSSLRRAHSDTSEIAANLRKLKGDGAKPKMVRVVTAPTLSSAENASSVSEQGALKPYTHRAVVMSAPCSTLPVIPDVNVPSSDSEHEDQEAGDESEADTHLPTLALRSSQHPMPASSDADNTHSHQSELPTTSTSDNEKPSHQSQFPVSTYDIENPSHHIQIPSTSASDIEAPPQAELPSTSSMETSAEGQGRQGDRKLERSHSVHRSPSEMDHLLSSLQELRSENSASAEQSEESDTAPDLGD